MNQSFVTVVLPFEAKRADAVRALAKAMGNPAAGTLSDDIAVLGIVHFMSINVVDGDRAGSAHLVFELSADGPADLALKKAATTLAPQLGDILAAAGIPIGRPEIAAFLSRYTRVLAADWLGTDAANGVLGIPFCGSPRMGVRRVLAERDLASRIGSWRDVLYGPAPALGKLDEVRQRLWQEGIWKWAFAAQHAPFLDPVKPRTLFVDLQILAASFPALLWPLLAPAIVIAFPIISWYSILFAVLILISLGGILYYRLMGAEATDIPDDIAPDPDRVRAVMDGENRCGLNLLFAVATVKPGLFRRLMLRLAFWVTGQALARSGRPGFLGDVGSVHFARWLLLPGTDQLVFASNYDGAWESYLEDFVDLVPYGPTAIWSNCRGFPRTRLLFGEGAKDGDRFRRWVRRQQLPTGFWYAAYPDLTLERMRINAQIRLGIASAQTEQEARAWLASFGAPG